MGTSTALCLPKYSDDEVKSFHPVFQRAADRAIDKLGLTGKIRAEHHRSFGGITVDFSFERIKNKRVILLAEIKRTPSAVQSTRYRYQAMSYRKEADAVAETPYYLLTNLEIADLFRYDSNRPRPASQLVKLLASSLKNPASFQAS